jgi:hypothetical protein
MIYKINDYFFIDLNNIKILFNTIKIIIR